MLLWFSYYERAYYMEGSHKEGESQEVQVGINKDSFNLVSILFCKTCNTQKYSLIACVCVCVRGGGV